MTASKIFPPHRLPLWAMAGVLSIAGVLPAQTLSFSFALDEPGTTSAGVYAPDGTLIRTLWSKVRYLAGTHSAVWNDLDDSSNRVPGGTYQIKLLQHNTEYVWDGAIGNTSADPSGPTVHNGFYPLRDMAIAGSNAYYVSGYNEGGYDFRNFLTADPQRVVLRWSPDNAAANIYDRNWKWTATDGIWVYFACNAATDPGNTLNNTYPGFIVASVVGSPNPAYSATFSQGQPIVNGMNTNSIYPNGVYVGTQPGLDGLAVQQNGNLLAASVAPDNLVYLLDKRAGSKLKTISVTAPGRLSFSPDGSLWVISGSSLVCFSNLNASPVAALTITNFAKPLAVAVNPSDANLILVADGGSSQQVKAFNAAGSPLWTHGLPGGYQTNGVAVATNKFWFNDGEADGTFLSFAPDGSFWVGDGGNFRALHFSAARNYLGQIMYQPHSYVACVDQNNPSRVFNQFLEFQVDYSKPLSQGWTLVNNWKVGLDPVHISWNQGLYEVTTFTNGRTYGLIDNNTYSFPLSELCELTTNQLRLTGIFPAYGGNARGWISIGPDGSARRTTIGAPTWYQATLAGFDAGNNPVWNPEMLLASAPAGATDPVPRGSSMGNIRATISSNNVLISFDQSLNNGWHLGGIKVGGSQWLWKASPAVAFMDGCGTYEISNGVQYAGNTVQAVDRQVIYGYHGEFFRGAGQASQIMHFYDDGLFVGQCGECNIGHPAYEGAVPASFGNGHCPSLIKTAGGYYVWVNDESGHGPQRWHLVNAGNIREQTGSGARGAAITLTNQTYNFPTAVSGTGGNQSATLNWQPVAGAISYNIRCSLLNGGPYDQLAGASTKPGITIAGLTNGLTYYFVVTALQGGVEGAPSEQVRVNPFDTTQTVLCAGSMAEGGQQTPVIEVSSSAASAGQKSIVGAEHLTGLLTLRDLNNYGYGHLQNDAVGTRGYTIIDYLGPATSLANILAPFALSYGGSWNHIYYLQRQYRADNYLTINQGMVAVSSGAIGISVTDTNFHYLTVISPAQFNNPRQFTMRLTSANGASASYFVNEQFGNSHIFQFLFRGNVTLWADGTGATVQSLFFDNAVVNYPSLLLPPSGFHIGQ
jgi:hypothetical protein